MHVNKMKAEDHKCPEPWSVDWCGQTRGADRRIRSLYSCRECGEELTWAEPDKGWLF